MIVDIMDLNFRTLNFSKGFDSARHSRAKEIYRKGYVQIDNVEKINNDTYEIEATVQGSYSYSYYNVELTISGIVINRAECNCEDFYKGNICKHILATSLEVIEPHMPSTDKKRKEILKQRENELKKRLEEERKRQIYEAKYQEGIYTIDLFKSMDNHINDVSTLNLANLYEEIRNNKNKKTENLATQIKLEPKIGIYDNNTLELSLKIGQDRMYSFNSLRNFLRAYQKKEKLYYGKQLSFIANKENFVPEAHELFDYIIDYADMVNFNDRFSNSRYGYSDKQLFISGDKIEKIFDMLKCHKIIGPSYTEKNIEYEFTDENLDIKCVLNKEKGDFTHYGFYEDTGITEEYVLRLNIKNYFLLYSNQYIYIFYENKIYRLKRENEIEKILNLFKDADEILIPKDRIDEFKDYVLPKIKYIETENLPAEIVNEAVITNKLACKMLLDVDSKENILLELKFCYGDFEFNILDSNYKNYVIENNIIRDIPAETETMKRIFFDGFELTSDRKYFILKNTDDIYDFLSYKIEGYMKDYEVLATDAFKNKEIRQPHISSLGVRVDNGLLEIDMSKMNIDLSEIKDILKDYSIKKKYHKLKSGDFLDLSQNEDLDLLDEMMYSLDIDYNKVKDGKVSLPVNRSIYLEKLLDSNTNINTTKNDQFMGIVNNFGNSEFSENIEIDKDLDNILRDYQKTGYRWLKTLDTYRFGGILADDMGLGKTLQVIAMLKSEVESDRKSTSIVVCPSTLVLNWKSEIEKWCNKINVLIIKGNAEIRKELIRSYENYDLIITSYDLLKRDVEEYEGKSFKYVIADEAQYIKNSLTQNATSLKSLNGEIKFALTGTPIENSVAELWSIFDFIMPGYLYNYHKFRKKFEEPILKLEDKEALIRLKKLISPFVLRRVKKEVLTELPEKNITIMKNEMEDEQEKIYLSFLAQTKKEIAEELMDKSFEKSKFKILMLLTRLRQICCHPSLFIENYNGGSGKLKQCLDLVVDAIDSGHKILLFSSYTSMFEIIDKELNKLKIKHFILARRYTC